MLKSAMAVAAITVNTDPSSLADPTLIDALKTASTKDSVAPACTAPAMAADTDAIKAQTSSLQSAITGVSTAAVKLQNAVDVVTASVQAKEDAAAHAARTSHIDAGNGYTFDITLVAGGPTIGQTGSGHIVGEGCGDFNPDTDLAVPYTVTLTSTTKNFDIPNMTTGIFIYGLGDVEISPSFGWSIGGYGSANKLRGGYEAELYYSSGSSCWQSDSTLIGVNWGPFPPGSTSTFNFTFIVKGYKNPNQPDGDSRLLSGIGLSASAWLSGSEKVITLDNKVAGG